jgi:hypothetical protein
MASDNFSWMVPIEIMLGSLNHGEVQACSISNVPDELREVNEDAYKPKEISIGLLHRGATRHLQLMEEPKWHYMRELLDRQGTVPEQNVKILSFIHCKREKEKLSVIVIITTRLLQS